MNRIIFYSFILAVFSTSLHGVPVNLLKEMMRDVDNLKRMVKGDDFHLRVLPANDSGDLSCYVAELNKLLEGGRVHGNNQKAIKKHIKKLIKKTISMNYSASNCTAHKKQDMTNEMFLNQMLRILQKKFSLKQQ